MRGEPVPERMTEKEMEEVEAKLEAAMRDFPVQVERLQSLMKQAALTEEELALRFSYHGPKEGQPELYEKIRSRHRSLAEFIVAVTPTSVEQNRAVACIEEAVFWANAAIARRS